MCLTFVDFLKIYNIIICFFADNFYYREAVNHITKKIFDMQIEKAFDDQQHYFQLVLSFTKTGKWVIKFRSLFNRNTCQNSGWYPRLVLPSRRCKDSNWSYFASLSQS